MVLFCCDSLGRAPSLDSLREPCDRVVAMACMSIETWHFFKDRLYTQIFRCQVCDKRTILFVLVVIEGL
jgi:hypothetical protein